MNAPILSHKVIHLRTTIYFNFSTTKGEEKEQPGRVKNEKVSTAPTEEKYLLADRCVKSEAGIVFFDLISVLFSVYLLSFSIFCFLTMYYEKSYTEDKSNPIAEELNMIYCSGCFLLIENDLDEGTTMVIQMRRRKKIVLK